MPKVNFTFFCGVLVVSGSVHALAQLPPSGGQPRPRLELPGTSPLAVLKDPSTLEAIRGPHVPQGFDNHRLRPPSPLAVLRDPSPLPAMNPGYSSQRPATQSSWDHEYRPPPYASEPWAVPSNAPRSSIAEIADSWRRLVRRFERFNTRANWQRNFAVPESLAKGQLAAREVTKTLKLMDYVDTHSEYHMVSKLPEFRRLKSQLAALQTTQSEKSTK